MMGCPVVTLPLDYLLVKAHKHLAPSTTSLRFFRMMLRGSGSTVTGQHHTLLFAADPSPQRMNLLDIVG